MPYTVKMKDVHIYPKGSTLNVRKQPATTAAVLKKVNAGQKAGITTGNWERKEDNFYWFELVGGGWVRQDVITLKNAAGTVLNLTFNSNTTNTNETQISDAEAKKRMDVMFANDRTIFGHLNKSNAYVAALKAKGVNTANYEKKLVELASSYTKRQQEVNNHQNIKTERSGVLSKVAEGASWLWGKVTSIFSGTEEEADNLGIAPIIIAVIVPVIKWACVAISAYFLYKAFKPSVEQSHIDLKQSEELEKALSTLNPEERQKVEKDIQGQIDLAYNKGKSEGSSLSSFLSTAKTLALIAGGVYLFKKFVLDKKKAQAPANAIKGGE